MNDSRHDERSISDESHDYRQLETLRASSEANCARRQSAFQSREGQRLYDLASARVRAAGLLDHKNRIRPGTTGRLRDYVATAVLQQWDDDKFLAKVDGACKRRVVKIIAPKPSSVSPFKEAQNRIRARKQAKQHIRSEFGQEYPRFSQRNVTASGFKEAQYRIRARTRAK